MSNDNQVDVQKKIRDLLEGAEKERARKRLAYGLAELGRGKIDYLVNFELLAFLPDHLAEIWESGSSEELGLLLGVLEKGCLSDESVIRENSIALMSIAVSYILDGGTIAQLARITDILTRWMRIETEFLPGYEIVALQLAKLLKRLLETANWQIAIELTDCLSGIAGGTIEKSNLIRRVAIRVQEKVADRETVRSLLKNLYGRGDGAYPANLATGRMLLGLGEPFVVNALALLTETAEDESETIVALLATGGKQVVEAILPGIDSGEDPVQLTCYKVQILGRMNREALYPRLAALLAHPAVEVQHEVLRGIIRNGLQLVPRLLAALDIIDDDLKVLVIKRLSQFSDDEINDRFLALLAEHAEGMRSENRQMVSALVVALGKEARLENLSTLKALRRGLSQDVDRVLSGLLEDSVNRLELALRKAEHRVIDDGAEFDEDPVSVRQTREAIYGVQQEVERLAAKRKTDQALQILKKSIRENLLAGKQSVAEALRDLILKTDHGAMEVLLEVEELLVEHQRAGAAGQNSSLWQELRTLLGGQVFEELFNAAQAERYQSGDIIIAQGELNDNLYFVASGVVALYSGSESREAFMKKLKAGTILGGESIFGISLASVTVRAQGGVYLYSLPFAGLARLEEENPGTMQVLKQYMAGQIDIPALLKMSGIDRRDLVRRKVTKTVETKILDRYGVVGQKSLKGRLKNISYGGFCYQIGFESEKGVRRLLGRQMQALFKVRDRQQIEVNGKFVAFERNAADDNTYFVHVRTLEPIDPNVFELIVQDDV